jgi:VWFA-related protein
VTVRSCAGALVPLVLWCAGLSAGALAKADAARQAQQQPVFRTSADLVTVPVSVRASGTPVGGLKPGDFVVLDNGVPQKVQSLDGESVPADITIVVETSLAMKDYLGSISEQVAKISAMIRPTDRVEVLGVGTYVSQLLPLKPAAEQATLGDLKAGGLASINDAMVAALLRQPDRERPHLIIVISDTIDTVSSSDMNTVRDVARQSGAILEIAWVTLELESGAWFTSAERSSRWVSRMITIGPGPPIGNARTVNRARYWIPHYSPPAGRHTDAFAALQQAAEFSGGKLHPRGIFLDRTASGIFSKLYDEYRHGYILRYTAEGVARDGWHEITVTAPKYPSYEIRARKGYLAQGPAK